MAFIAKDYNTMNKAQQIDANELIQALLEYNPNK